MEQQPSSVKAVLINQPLKVNPDITTILFGKHPAIGAPQNVCPNGRIQCPSLGTCCLNKTGGYNCCNYPNVVCCSDRVHCCPLGYGCNAAGMCIQQHVVCPDLSFCPLKHTCCLLSTGAYGCCNLSDATCCSDGAHCCALGYSCNNDGTCKKTREVCPNQSTCPLSTTCCLLKSADYGCCPLPNAVCCRSDTCCPSGHYCYSDGKCSAKYFVSTLSRKQSASQGSIVMKPPAKKDSITAIVMKQPAIKAPQNIICPDGTSECASNNTCCASSSGGYGCCPLLNAACCSDGQHCCPIGYKCDIDTDTCTKVNVVCPDQSSLCPLDNTCCVLASGKYGCCPNPNAVCCSDGEHCCPEGYTCNISAGTCVREASLVSMTSKSAPYPGGGTYPHGNQPTAKLSPTINAEQGDFL